LTAVEPVQSALETPPTPPANAIGSAALYQQFHQQGFNYGPAFQGVTQVWRTKTGVIGQIQLPAQLVTEANCYILHPALLDACFQILAAASEDNSSTDTPFLYLPVAIQALRLHRPAPLNLWCRTENLRLEASGQQLQTNLVLFDESGTVIVEVVGLTLQRVNRQALMRSFQPNLDNWLYRIDWQALDALTGSVVTPEDRWLVFVDSGGLGEALVKQLESLGATCLRVVAGTRYRRLKKQTVVVNPSQLEDFQRLVADYLEGELSYRGIIHLWGAAGTKTLTAEAVTALQSVLCGSVLYLVQALLKSNPAIFPQLWLVSRGSQLVAGQAPTQPQAGSLWGLGRVLMLEHPDLRCRCLDLAPQPELDESEQLLIEITAGTAETQLAYRQGQRYGARLVRYRATQAAELGLTVPTTPYQVRIREYGIFENLQLVAAERQTPGPDQVEIAVRAVGLNFRDVLNALGMLQSFTEAMGVIDTTEVPFGGECAGIVTAVGDHVRHLAVGDEVIAAQAIGSLSSHVVVPAAFVVPKPATLSYEAAATIPTAFLTAYYGLYHQAQLQAGERVLVHAAAGGVGQAAVQISQWLGAEVWGTASEPKWPVLKQMGVTQVFNSRNLEFAEQVATLTQAQGVDVVLNSLNGDFIPATLSTLGSRGRFVEIGKLGIWSAEQVAEARPDVTYLPFDLLDISIETPTQIRTWLQELLPLFEQGKLTPLPHRIFSIENLVEAFRYMAQAKHVGKVVIGLPVDSAPDANQAKQTDSALAIRAQGTYLVTGGFGALGQQVARWLVQQGARHLVLTGRRIPTDVPILAELEQQGAIVQAVAADISQISAVAALIAQIEANEPPLRGIFHTAGVLADSMLAGQTWERFEQVMAPKIAGSWLLHEQTQGLELDCFVFFSSVSAVVGSPGQANYAAANAFMDTLAAYRWGLGLPALSINWGPWSESGMAAALQSRDLARWAAQGVGLIEPAQGMSLLGQLLAEASYAQTIVLPVDWGRYLAQIPPDLTPPLLESFTQEYQLTEAETPAFLPELQAATPSQRRPLLLHHVQANLAKVLGLTNPEALDPQQGLAELGMDSLMAIELRNRLQSSLGCPVPATLAFDYPTIAALVDYLAGVLNLGSGDDQGGEDDLLAITAPQTEPETNQADLDELSDSEAEALLMDKLDSMRY
jgi:myxalamid-type polyketide synthase MxaB